MSKSTSRASELFADMKRFYEHGGFSKAKSCYSLLMEEYGKSRKNMNDASFIHELVKDANELMKKMPSEE